jgi:iron complex transport system ATP-binding protein
MMLQARDIYVRRNGAPVLTGVSVQLQSGETVGLLGANGAGKSTLLAVLANELVADSGEITIDADPAHSMTPSAQARRRAVLPQNPSLAFDLTVEEVVAMGAYPFPELSPSVVQSAVRAALIHADAAALFLRRYLDLSGGEQQRVQFARALVQCLVARVEHDSRYLLLDEPTASQDPPHQSGLLKTVSNLARVERLGVLVVLHDVNLAARWCDRLLLLAEGAIVADGSPAEVLTEPLLARVYGVAARVLAHPLMPNCPLVLFE